MIRNPILPGFNPDPSIIRVGEDYYIAVSSFEWYPGIPIYHSRDLKHWRLLDYALKTPRHIDLQSLAPSKGVWAPCLSYNSDEELYYIVYSNVYDRNRWHFEVDNFLIYSDSINGPWSEPVYINSSGFDPSLFHDGEKKWILNQDRDFRPGMETRRPIIIQEYDTKEQKLIGKPVRLTYGATVRGYTEGAHLYKRNGFYYLTTAEGGTGYGHCVALLRSKNVLGPYEVFPNNPILTSCAQDIPMNPDKSFKVGSQYNPNTVIQKSGHGSLVETQTGQWYMVHLCGRPIMPGMRCVLGRETAIQKMEWTEDGWLRMSGGTNIAQDNVPEPDLKREPFFEKPITLEGCELDLRFNSPRNAITPDWAKLEGTLKLRGRESLSSNHWPSLIACRLTSFKACVTVKLEFEPDSYHHLAGLTCYYDSSNYFYIAKTYSEEMNQSALTVYGLANRQLQETAAVLAIQNDAAVWLRAEIDMERLRFCYSANGIDFKYLGGVFDMTALSDEASNYGEFTGTFVGLFAQDSHLREKWAQFSLFEYIEETE